MVWCVLTSSNHSCAPSMSRPVSGEPARWITSARRRRARSKLRGPRGLAGSPSTGARAPARTCRRRAAPSSARCSRRRTTRRCARATRGASCLRSGSPRGRRTSAPTARAAPAAARRRGPPGRDPERRAVRGAGPAGAGAAAPPELAGAADDDDADGAELRRDLLEKEHYALVPAGVWRALRGAYGVRGPALARARVRARRARGAGVRVALPAPLRRLARRGRRGRARARARRARLLFSRAEKMDARAARDRRGGRARGGARAPERRGARLRYPLEEATARLWVRLLDAEAVDAQRAAAAGRRRAAAAPLRAARRRRRRRGGSSGAIDRAWVLVDRGSSADDRRSPSTSARAPRRCTCSSSRSSRPTRRARAAGCCTRARAGGAAQGRRLGRRDGLGEEVVRRGREGRAAAQDAGRQGPDQSARRGWTSKWDATFERDDAKVQPLFRFSENWRALRIGDSVEIRDASDPNKPLWYEGEVDAGSARAASSRRTSRRSNRSTVGSRWSLAAVGGGVRARHAHQEARAAGPARGGADAARALRGRGAPRARRARARTRASARAARRGAGARARRAAAGRGRGRALEPRQHVLHELDAPVPEQHGVPDRRGRRIETRRARARARARARRARDQHARNPLARGRRRSRARTRARALVAEVWSGEYTVVVPSELKRLIGRFASQFSGYQQQDSQEFMSFILDGIHEDLNRIQKKPYTEALESTASPTPTSPPSRGGPPPRAQLERARRLLLRPAARRLVTARSASHESITFDPYSSLSLPLPVQNTRRVPVTLTRLPLGSRPLKLVVTVPRDPSVKQLKDALCALAAGRGVSARVDPARVHLCDVWTHRVYRGNARRRRAGRSPTRSRGDDVVFAYELAHALPAPVPRPRTRSETAGASYTRGRVRGGGRPRGGGPPAYRGRAGRGRARRAARPAAQGVLWLAAPAFELFGDPHRVAVTPRRRARAARTSAHVGPLARARRRRRRRRRGRARRPRGVLRLGAQREVAVQRQVRGSRTRPRRRPRASSPTTTSPCSARCAMKRCTLEWPADAGGLAPDSRWARATSLRGGQGARGARGATTRGRRPAMTSPTACTRCASASSSASSRAVRTAAPRRRARSTRRRTRSSTSGRRARRAHPPPQALPVRAAARASCTGRRSTTSSRSRSRLDLGGFVREDRRGRAGRVRPLRRLGALGRARRRRRHTALAPELQEQALVPFNDSSVTEADASRAASRRICVRAVLQAQPRLGARRVPERRRSTGRTPSPRGRSGPAARGPAAPPELTTQQAAATPPHTHASEPSRPTRARPPYRVFVGAALTRGR